MKELKEEYFKPLTSNTGRAGGSYADMSFDVSGQKVIVQTVDKGSVNGMSQREWTNAQRISQQAPSAIVVTVVKGTTPQSLDVRSMTVGQVNRR